MTEEHGRGATLDQGTVYAHNRGARAVAGGSGSGWGGSADGGSASGGGNGSGLEQGRLWLVPAGCSDVGLVLWRCWSGRGTTRGGSGSGLIWGRGIEMKSFGIEMKSFGPPPWFK